MGGQLHGGGFQKGGQPHVGGRQLHGGGCHMGGPAAQGRGRQLHGGAAAIWGGQPLGKPATAPQLLQT